LTGISVSETEALKEQFPEVFRPSFGRRFGLQIGILGLIAYFIFAWNLFSVGQILKRADWDLAGIYLADWISYEVRPDIEMTPDGALAVGFPKYSPLGFDPKPEWLEVETGTVVRKIVTPTPDQNNRTAASSGTPENTASRGFSFMNPGAKGTSGGSVGAQMGTDGSADNTLAVASETIEAPVRVTALVGNGSVEVFPGRVVLSREAESVILNVEDNVGVTAESPLPDWAVQNSEKAKVTAYFGFAGRVIIDDDEVKIRKRFVGWENFLFDTTSPFWGKSFGEVAGLIFSAPRIKPEQSNLALAWDNILYNSEWQHLDVFIKLGQTIVMAFVGTLFASVIAFPMAFISARNITPSGVLNQTTKRVFDFLRSVDMFIWALFFTRAFGPGPLAGISAIFFTDTGTLGKLYSEALENIDEKQREGVRSVGANPVLVQRYGVVPQVLPVFASQSLYFWESNTRSATIIGAVGAGGIGLKLWESMLTNSDWENVAYMVLLILIVVFVFDTISSKLRGMLMSKEKAL